MSSNLNHWNRFKDVFVKVQSSIVRISNKKGAPRYTLNNPEVMRFEPPLIITDNQIDQVVGVFRDAVLDVQQMLEEFGVV